MKTAADAGAPGTVSLDVTVLVVFIRLPNMEPSLVTPTLKVQLAPATRLAPTSVMRLPPAMAPIVPPPQEPVDPFGVDITRPAGSVSENASPSSVMVLFAFFKVNVNGTEDL